MPTTLLFTRPHGWVENLPGPKIVADQLIQGPLKIWTEHSNFPLQGRGTQNPL